MREAGAMRIVVIGAGPAGARVAERVAQRLALYTGYGFEPLRSDGLRLFLPMATVRALMRAGA